MASFHCKITMQMHFMLLEVPIAGSSAGLKGCNSQASSMCYTPPVGADELSSQMLFLPARSMRMSYSRCAGA